MNHLFNRRQLKFTQTLLCVVPFICLGCKSRVISSSTKAIYGEDDRQDTWKVEDPRLRETAKSAVMLIRKDKLQRVGDFFEFKSKPLHELEVSVSEIFGAEEEKLKLCRKDLKFADQPSTGFCSGAYVEWSQFKGIGTAGHCVHSSFDCDKTAVVFDFKMGEGDQPPGSIPAENVYFCKEVFAARDETYGGTDFVDFAFLKLDREVSGRNPLRMHTSPAAVGQKLTVIGHPLGVPQKVSKGTVKVTAGANFGADFDSLNGNSGSPVLDDDSYSVLGFWANGSRMSFRKVGDCAVVRACNEECGQWNMTTAVGSIPQSPLQTKESSNPKFSMSKLSKTGKNYRTSTDTEGFLGTLLAPGEYDLTTTWLDIPEKTTISVRAAVSSIIVTEGHLASLEANNKHELRHKIRITETGCKVTSKGAFEDLNGLTIQIDVNGQPRQQRFFLPCPNRPDVAKIEPQPSDIDTLEAGKSEVLQTKRPACLDKDTCECNVEYKTLWWGEVWKRTYPVTWTSRSGRSHFCSGFKDLYKDPEKYVFWITEKGVGRHKAF